MNLIVIAKYFDWTVNDKLLCFTTNVDDEARPAAFMCIDKYAGGHLVFQNQVWATAVNDMDENYRDRLFNILNGKATDCYLYEQDEDYPARIYSLQSFGWKRISEDIND